MADGFITTVDDTVLKPGTGIDLVINLHSLAPVSSSSVIFDADQNRHTMLIALPERHADLKKDQKVTLHVSTLIRDETGEMHRVGFPCKIVKFIDTYPLANGTTTSAAVVSYKPTPEPVNVRNAFRYSPTSTHEVMGKMVIVGHDFFSGKDFRISDISITGVGLVIPREINRVKNPLTALEAGRVARLGLVLRDHTKEPVTMESIDTAIQIMRINRRHNEVAMFAGCRFNRIPSQAEDILSRFIHNAQLHEIRSVTHS